MNDSPRVLALVSNEEEDPSKPVRASGSVLWRIFQPYAELQRQGYPAEWEWKDNRSLDVIGPLFDVFVAPRLSWKREHLLGATYWFSTMRRAGKTMVYEVDDDLFSPWIVAQQKGGIAEDRTIEELEQDRLDRIAALCLCDGVTVSTQRLATIVQQYTDAPIAVVPNLLDLRWFRAVQRMGAQMQPRQMRTLTIGWAGGARPDRDLEAMATAWARVARKHPHVTFVVQGHQPRCIYEQVPNERIQPIAWLPLETYPLGLREIDIGCCPLSDVSFNRAKSGIKAWEYAASGAAVVASPTVYRQTITHGESGFLCETADEWEAALLALVEDEYLRRKLARRLLRTVEQRHSLETQVWRWPAAWRQLQLAAQQPTRQRLILATAQQPTRQRLILATA